MMKYAFKDGYLLKAAQHMRTLSLEERNEAIAMSPNVVDIRHLHRGYVSE